MDDSGNVIVAWINETIYDNPVSLGYSNNPSNPGSWIKYSDPFGLGDFYSFDIAWIEGPEVDDYKGLFCVYLISDGYYNNSGYSSITDITNTSTWNFYTWSTELTQQTYASVSDGGSFDDIYYPDIRGPFNMFIYHYNYSGNIIPHCPVLYHTDIPGDDGGIFYFDAQSFEKTSPANDPDMITLEDRIHTAVQYTNATTGSHIVWKKIVPSIEPDYEYTPFQDTITEGENPAIAAYETEHVAIVYQDNGLIKCISSLDDGGNWTTSIISSGSFPDVYAIDEILYSSYIANGNLYLVTSIDGGLNWGSPIQINDVNGTVVAEENSVDIHDAGIVWTDNRNGNNDIFFSELPISNIITSVVQGWNIISIPFNQPIDKVLLSVEYNGNDYSWGDAVTNGFINNFVFGWDRNIQSYFFADTLESGDGYWIYAYQPCTLKRVT